MNCHILRTRLVQLCCLAAVLSNGSAANAYDETNWTGPANTTADWFDAGNWSNGVPTSEKLARIANSSVAEVNDGLVEADVIEVAIPGYGPGGTLRQSGGVVRARDVQIFRSFLASMGGTYELLGGTLHATEYLHLRDTLNWYGGQIITAQFKPNDDGGRLNIGFDFAMSELLDGTLMGGADIVQNHGVDLTVLGLTRGANVIHENSSLTLSSLDIGMGDSATYYLGENAMLTFGRQVDIGGSLGTSFTQDGGTVRVTTGFGPVTRRLGIGFQAATSGTYELVSGQIDVDQIAIGTNGEGVFHQKGGVVQALRNGIHLSGVGGQATYIMDAGEIRAGGVGVGHHQGAAHFIQNGGEVRAVVGVGSGLTLPGEEFGGIYDFHAGFIQTYETLNNPTTVVIGGIGKGLFRQFGGLMKNTQVLIGEYSDLSSGSRFELHDGRMEAGFIRLGDYGTVDPSTGFVQQSGGEIVMFKPSPVEQATITVANGEWLQTGGSVETSVVLLGFRDNSSAVWRLSGGVLSAEQVQLGNGYADSLGRLTIDGPGRLNVGRVTVGEDHVDSFGRFDLTSADAEVTIHESLDFGRMATFTAAPGATIHMESADFINRRRENSAMSGLHHLRVIFSGSDETIPTFEVASKDLGASSLGFTNNFAINTLQLTGLEDTQVQLTNEIVNQVVGSEALYVRRLELGAGATLDLNGINLYYLTSSLDPSANVLLNGGQLFQIDLPSVPGDTNGDLMVNITDLNNVRNNFGGAGLGDTDGNGNVDIQDLNAVRNNFGNSVGAQSVPEPTTAPLLAIAATALASTTRRSFWRRRQVN